MVVGSVAIVLIVIGASMLYVQRISMVGPDPGGSA